ncbi:hypothetical protein ABIA43_006559 [Bradyrhizobium sp. USDA 328]|jgi:hypothetical protein
MAQSLGKTLGVKIDWLQRDMALKAFVDQWLHISMEDGSYKLSTPPGSAGRSCRVLLSLPWPNFGPAPGLLNPEPPEDDSYQRQ